MKVYNNFGKQFNINLYNNRWIQINFQLQKLHTNEGANKWAINNKF